MDTEFLEGPQKQTILGIIVGNSKPTIDLISIGIVSEDGREYYAISKDFNLKEAWNRYDEIKDGFRDFGLTPNYKKVYWIRENVLKPIYYELINKDVNFHNYDQFFTYKAFKRLINKYGKTNKEIAEDIIEFAQGDPVERNNPIFYTYYGAYDWVVFCWIFGKMLDLPRGFPMFSKDLKVMLDDKVSVTGIFIGLKNKDNSFKARLDFIKKLPNYPKQNNEHNALDDAKWNKKLYEFLNTL